MKAQNINTHKAQIKHKTQNTKPKRVCDLCFGESVFCLCFGSCALCFFRVSGLEFRVCRAARGFTLIELVVYVALLSVISLVTVNSILILNRTLVSFRLERRLTISADTAMRRIGRELRLANDIYASSTLGVSPGVLSLNSQESEEDAAPKDVMMYMNGDRLVLRRATSSIVFLTAGGVTVSSLVFRQINNGTASKSVKVELTLSASAGSASTTKNYYTTIVLRGSY